MKSTRMLHKHPLSNRFLEVSINRGAQIYTPQNTLVLVMGPPKKVPLILGNTLLVTNLSETISIPDFSFRRFSTFF